MKTELDRLRQNVFLERPLGPTILVTSRATNPSSSLAKVKQVLELVAAEHSERSSWPSDELWSKQLPAWFTEPFRGRSIEDVLANETLWDFGSWLDAMRQRGWQWWSSSCVEAKGEWTAVLSRDEMVYSIEPLIYLVRQSGASSVEVTEELPLRKE